MATLSIIGSTSFAQSSVTLYGVVDTGYRSVTSGSNKFSGVANGSNATSRLGVKGTEDLGGGMAASFVMEGELTPNDGTNAGFKFLRQSTLGLSSSLGEVRLGRDYTPAFRVFGIVDPFGTVGVGSAGNLMWSTVLDGAPAGEIGAAGTFITPAASSQKPASSVTARTIYSDPSLIRANNSLAYYSPDFNGFKASLMYSFGAQNTYSLKKTGDMTSASLNYANGPLTVAYANQASKGGATDATDNQKFTTNFLAGSYNFGVAKAALGYRTEKLDLSATTAKTKSMIYSVLAPVGAVTLKASYITKKVTWTNGDTGKAGSQLAVGAVYDLSKRTALYATYSRLKNESGAANSVGSAAASTGGVSSKGFDIGARHSF